MTKIIATMLSYHRLKAGVSFKRMKNRSKAGSILVEVRIFFILIVLIFTFGFIIFLATDQQSKERLVEQKYSTLIERANSHGLFIPIWVREKTEANYNLDSVQVDRIIAHQKALLATNGGERVNSQNSAPVEK